MPKWTKVIDFKGGHKFFTREDQPGVIYVADASGETPDQTDDGPLSLDFTAMAQIRSVVLPVSVGDGSHVRTWITARAEEAEFLVRLYSVDADKRAEVIDSWARAMRVQATFRKERE